MKKLKNLLGVKTLTKVERLSIVGKGKGDIPCNCGEPTCMHNGEHSCDMH